MSNVIPNLLHALGVLIFVLLLGGLFFYRSRYNQAKSGAESTVRQAQNELKLIEEKIAVADKDARIAQSQANTIVSDAKQEAATIIQQARAEEKSAYLRLKRRY